MKIRNKQILSDYEGVRVVKIEIVSPHIAQKAQPGQFVVLMVSEEGERLPLTVAEKDIKKGTITLIFQEAGLTTRLLGKLSVGDSLYSLVGPLGHPTEIKKYGKV
ncbi:MAG: sulfide/dihydroorotate dehydrogenase-like FAD/NAD-binding protein, partial [Anaerolineae bacterium]